MAIAPDSTGYPTLAEIQASKIVDPQKVGQMYEVGHMLHKYARRGDEGAMKEYARGHAPTFFIGYRLVMNHIRAAKAHGYWGID